MRLLKRHPALQLLRREQGEAEISVLLPGGRAGAGVREGGRRAYGLLEEHPAAVPGSQRKPPRGVPSHRRKVCANKRVGVSQTLEEEKDPGIGDGRRPGGSGDRCNFKRLASRRHLGIYHVMAHRCMEVVCFSTVLFGAGNVAGLQRGWCVACHGGSFPSTKGQKGVMFHVMFHVLITSGAAVLSFVVEPVDRVNRVLYPPPPDRHASYRTGLQKADEQLISLMMNENEGRSSYVVVVTKCDKVNDKQVRHEVDSQHAIWLLLMLSLLSLRSCDVGAIVVIVAAVVAPFRILHPIFAYLDWQQQ